MPPCARAVDDLFSAIEYAGMKDAEMSALTFLGILEELAEHDKAVLIDLIKRLRDEPMIEAALADLEG